MGALGVLLGGGPSPIPLLYWFTASSTLQHRITFLYNLELVPLLSGDGALHGTPAPHCLPLLPYDGAHHATPPLAVSLYSLVMELVNIIGKMALAPSCHRWT